MARGIARRGHGMSIASYSGDGLLVPSPSESIK
jgi:hypothetical protein